MASTLHHWKDGAPYEGTGGRFGDVTNPATGEVSAQVAMASEADVDEIVAAALAAFPRWRDTSLAKRTQVLFAFRELLNARKEELAAIITAEHGKVLSDALGEVSRGQEVVEFACGIPHLLKGGVHRERLDQGRRALDPAAARRGRDHLARSTSRRWCRCGSTRSPSPPGTPWWSSRARRTRAPSLWIAELWKEAGLPDGVYNVLQRRQGGRRRAADPPGRAVDLVRRLHPDRPLRLRDRDHARQAGAGARWGQEPHAGAARRRPRSGRRPGGQRRLRLGRRALHGDLGGAGRRRHRRHAGGQDRRTGPLAADRRRHPRLRHGTAGHRAQARDRVSGYVDAGEAAGATLVVDGRQPDGGRRRGRASSSGRRCSTT